MTRDQDRNGTGDQGKSDSTMGFLCYCLKCLPSLMKLISCSSSLIHPFSEQLSEPRGLMWLARVLPHQAAPSTPTCNFTTHAHGSSFPERKVMKALDWQETWILFSDLALMGRKEFSSSDSISIIYEVSKILKQGEPPCTDRRSTQDPLLNPFRTFLLQLTRTYCKSTIYCKSHCVKYAQLENLNF